MQQKSSLEEYIESLMFEESINDLITVLSDTLDTMQLDDNIAGFNSNTSNNSGSSECAGSYPVSGYTRSDGTEVSGYIRTCGAAHNGNSNNTNTSDNKNSENDWDYVNPEDFDEYLDNDLLQDYYNYRTSVLEGNVEYDANPSIQDYFKNNINKIKNVYSKYKNLSILEAAQKAASKISYGQLSEKQYYGYASNLADGEEPSDFMKEQNDFYKLKDITDPELKRIYTQKAAAMYGLDPSAPDTYERVKNTDIVIPKQNSQLYNQIKNSETFQKWVAENYWNIKNNEDYKTSIEFPKAWKNDNAQRSLFATIHNADLYPILNDDGSMSLILSDGYDFSFMNKMNYFGIKDFNNLKSMLKHNILANINNNAYKQQITNQISNYLLSAQIVLSKEELEEILQKYEY